MQFWKCESRNRDGQHLNGNLTIPKTKRQSGKPWFSKFISEEILLGLRTRFNIWCITMGDSKTVLQNNRMAVWQCSKLKNSEHSELKWKWSNQTNRFMNKWVSRKSYWKNFETLVSQRLKLKDFEKAALP